MLPILHPLSKTAVDVRRAVGRLEIFMKSNADDEHVTSGCVARIIADLKSVQSHIPHELMDVDLNDND